MGRIEIIYERQQPTCHELLQQIQPVETADSDKSNFPRKTGETPSKSGSNCLRTKLTHQTTQI